MAYRSVMEGLSVGDEQDGEMERIVSIHDHWHERVQREAHEVVRLMDRGGPGWSQALARMVRVMAGDEVDRTASVLWSEPEDPHERLVVPLPKTVIEELDKLRETGTYGHSWAAVVRYLIYRGLDDLNSAPDDRAAIPRGIAEHLAMSMELAARRVWTVNATVGQQLRSDAAELRGYLEVGDGGG